MTSLDKDIKFLYAVKTYKMYYLHHIDINFY